MVIYIFVVYLATLSIAQIIQRRMIRRLINDELGSTLWPITRDYSGTRLDGLRKTTKPSVQDSWC
jgi:hypothetical protein